MANEQANVLFGLTLEHQGRPIQELEAGRLVDFSALCRRLYRNRRPVTLRNIAWATPTDTKYFDIAFAPVFKQKRYLLAVNLTFIDTTCNQQLDEKLKLANSELAQLSQTSSEQALDSTHAQLESLNKN